MAEKLFSAEVLEEAWEIIRTQFPLAIWETVYVTILSTAFAILIGLPLGVLLVTGEKDGINYRLVSSDYLQFCPLDISYLVQNAK